MTSFPQPTYYPYPYHWHFAHAAKNKTTAAQAAALRAGQLYILFPRYIHNLIILNMCAVTFFLLNHRFEDVIILNFNTNKFHEKKKREEIHGYAPKTTSRSRAACEFQILKCFALFVFKKYTSQHYTFALIPRVAGNVKSARPYA